MLRKSLTFLLSGVFLFSCGGYDSIGLSDDSSSEACVYDVVNALDDGNYDYVIQKLSSDITCSGGFTVDEGKMNLAAAYVGKAGFSIPDLVNDILKTQTDIDFNNYQYDKFIEVLSTKANISNIQMLHQASSLYREIIADCNVQDLTDIQKDACFYRGLVEAAKSSVSLAYSLENVIAWLNPEACEDLNNNSIGDNGDMEACALEYAINDSCTIPGVSLTQLGFVTFEDGTTYESIKLVVSSSSPECSNNESYKLIYRDQLYGTVVLTEGYCNVNREPCDNPDGITCVPCPAKDVNGNPYTIEETVLNAIESAANLITEVVGNTNTDVKDAVDDFRSEVCAAADNDPTTCTTEDLVQYLTSSM
ncbi:hypothetical protein [Persephonella sp.]